MPASPAAMVMENERLSVGADESAEKPLQRMKNQLYQTG
jgi:hypothetical protein